MTKFGKLCFVIACSAASLLVAQDQKAANLSRPIAIRAARLIDGRNDAGRSEAGRNEAPLVVLDAVIIVEGEKITAVGSHLPIPQGATVIDLGDVTLLPGLIDSHTHLLSEMDGTNLSLQDIAML